MSVISHKITGLTNDVTQYVRIFPCNPDGLVQSELENQWTSADTAGFPEEPTAYELIETVTASKTFTAPENGWYQVEVFGASGTGGKALAYVNGGYDDVGDYVYDGVYAAGGGGGGSGGYALSVIKLNKGDTVTLIIGAIGSTTSATVDSTNDDSYDHTLQVTSAGNGENAGYSGTPGSGGSGGVASGGNVSNINGNNGSVGTGQYRDHTATGNGGAGGSAVVSGGTVGGTGGQGYSNCGDTTGTIVEQSGTGVAGQSGFIKIYRGNTNVA